MSPARTATVWFLPTSTAQSPRSAAASQSQPLPWDPDQRRVRPATRSRSRPVPTTQCQTGQNSVAKQRRKRISEKTAELTRLIPGAHRLNTAETMLEEAARHVKLLQAQVGVMRAAAEMQEEKKMPSAMHALLACGWVQERMAAEGKCLVPTSLVDAVAKDDNPVVRRDLGRFVRQGQ